MILGDGSPVSFFTTYGGLPSHDLFLLLHDLFVSSRLIKAYFLSVYCFFAALVFTCRASPPSG
jgi:hypothetical protein